MILSTEKILLLEGIFRKYGYDFRNYSPASIGRRIDVAVRKMQVQDELELLSLLMKDPQSFEKVLSAFSITTSELFRDPIFFRSLRDKVLPLLSTYANLNIWVAGCSTGQEIYSLAILFHEENLLHRCQIYATDINPHALAAAKEGIYSAEAIKVFTKNYVAFGGKLSPSDYYTADYERARMRPFLREHVTFSEHNLAIDQVFIEAHLILCRNVLIYFNRELQNRCFGLFKDSLVPRGFLGIGQKETIRLSPLTSEFEGLDEEMKIYRLKRPQYKNWNLQHINEFG